MAQTPTITYTLTDEAPALATYSLLPIVEAFARAAGIGVETADISLAGRVMAAFPESLPAEQRQADDLARLGEMTQDPSANIIKLPNISASVPQLKECVAELQARGIPVPDYPDEPATDEEREIQARYDKIKGSAVNPVLREGNSDRRAPNAVKAYARRNPHSMGAWSSESATTVATMGRNDFRSNEVAATAETDTTVSIVHTATDGTETVLKSDIAIAAGTVMDSTFMSVSALRGFLNDQIGAANDAGVLFSLHMKATMMKVSDPIIFGHAVRAYFAPVFERWGAELDAAGANPNNGWGNVVAAIGSLDADVQSQIQADIDAVLAERPPLAMVDSDNGITNLHVPSDIIIDASMPAMIRSSGQMWNPEGNQQDAVAVIPDSSYAPLYEETIEFCKANGAFDPTTMGTVPNVGLMAQKAEEYGSHDKTFEIAAAGTVSVIDAGGAVVMSHEVETGDIWRMCTVTDAAIADWVALAVRRASATGWPAVFWLDETRAHDAQLLAKVRPYLDALDTDGLDIRIHDVRDATRLTLERAAAGENTISVTGNVLRDYLTDLFPILELGTSAKMLSVVPLMKGGGLFETGAGGSAPKHVQQFVAENHLRWDSLGEFLALTVSFEHLADVTGNPQARILGDTLDVAIEKLLVENRSPKRKVNELDNRGSHFYLALYWAEALALQTDDSELARLAAPFAQTLAKEADTIVDELNAVQGNPVQLDGYYRPNGAKAVAAMRPSETFNRAIEGFAS